MNTEERLNKIKSRCEQLLALAENRTPGKWEAYQGWKYDTHPEITAKEHPDWCEITGPKSSLSGHIGFADAAFLAACAGSAEAGWRATVAAIDGLRELDREMKPWAEAQLRAIISAWEGVEL